MKSYLRYLNRKFTLNEKVLLAIFASAYIGLCRNPRCGVSSYLHNGNQAMEVRTRAHA